jgi:hypothetical protein
MKLQGGKIQKLKILNFTFLESEGVMLTLQPSIDHVHIREMLWICVREVPGTNLGRVTSICDIFRSSSYFRRMSDW